MNLERILAVSGKPGLYDLKIQTRTGFVAESLVDGKKSTIGLKNNVSLLSEISIYTYSGEEKLFSVFEYIAKKENNGPAISHKEDNSVLVGYFREVLPEFDEERVYISDIKKVLNWYNILQKRGLVTFEVAEEKVEENKTAAKKTSEKKVATKKTSEKKETEKKEVAEKKAPAKKAPAKKVAENKEVAEKKAPAKKTSVKKETTAKKPAVKKPKAE